MKQKGYPFQFVGTDTTDADQYLQKTFIYRFRSAKSRHRYTVQVEQYIDNLYCVKFFDEATKLVLGKFSQLSGTYEPRAIFSTIADIALDIYNKDPLASFCFVGASDGKDNAPGVKNRRYRVYSLYLKDLGIEHLFKPWFIDRYSMCVLVNLKAVADRQSYVSRIVTFFT